MKTKLLFGALALSFTFFLVTPQISQADTPEQVSILVNQYREQEAQMPIWERTVRILFTPRYFEPHAIHFFDNTGLMWSIVVANIGTVIAYLLIPIVLVFFIKKRKDLAFTGIFWLFSAFIVLCGLHHLVHVITFWYPLYYVQNIIDIATGLVSLATLFSLLRVLPRAIQLRSVEELETVNNQLRAEVENRKAAEKRAVESERRIRDNNKRLQQALDKAEEARSDLEEINKLMVGRELKMVELKEKLSEEEVQDSKKQKKSPKAKKSRTTKSKKV